MPKTPLLPGRTATAATLADLQERIARIEGRPLHRLMPATGPATGPARPDGLRTGPPAQVPSPAPASPAAASDEAASDAAASARQAGPEAAPAAPYEAAGPGFAGLTASLRQPGLTEIHVDDTRGSGSGAGFVLALAVLFGARAGRPALWIGANLGFSEGGMPYLPGISGHGLTAGALLLVRTRRLEEAIWAGEEAARSAAAALTILEVRGNPGRLGLEGTRRLHVRARDAGTPLLLLRQSGRAEATAAPLRLRIAPAPAADVTGIGDGAKLIGHPVFAITVEKSRDGRPYHLLLEWNPHERRFQAPAEPHSRDRAALPVDRPDPARPAGTLLALRRAS